MTATRLSPRTMPAATSGRVPSGNRAHDQEFVGAIDADRQSPAPAQFREPKLPDAVAPAGSRAAADPDRGAGHLRDRAGDDHLPGTGRGPGGGILSVGHGS